MEKKSLGDRMKAYENVNRVYLTPRIPTIIRVDGRAFHSYTKKFNKPYDSSLSHAMIQTAKALVKDIGGADLAYIQSDEISILINDYKRFSSQAWFQKNLQKMASISASIATAYFNQNINEQELIAAPKKPAMFDSRCFCVPEQDVVNYFIWRQRDASRNSVLSYGQAHFSHKKIHKKNTSEIIKMLLEKGIDWEKLPPYLRHGVCVRKTLLENGRSSLDADYDLPEFSENRTYISDLVEIREV